MSPARAKAVADALGAASSEYQKAAQDEMDKGAYNGSIHNIYSMVKESYALEGKIRNLSRRWGIDACNCA